MAECCDTSVTEIEEGLADIVTLPEVVTNDWIDDSLDVIALRVNELASQHTELELSEAATQVRKQR